MLRALHVLSWLIWLAAASVFAAPPGSVKATYDVYKNNLRVGQINETFSRNKDRYTLVSTTRAVGLLALFQSGRIVIRSSGLVTDKGLQPLHFSDLRSGDESKTHRAEFDWSGKKLTLIQQPQDAVLSLPDGTQDRLSAMYQFMFLPLEKSESLSFSMTNGNKLDDYHYRITPNQNVTVPLGTFNAVYLSSVPEKGANKTEIWLVAEHHYFPYKMTITDPDGDRLTQALTKIDFTP